MALAFVAAACGSDDDNERVGATTTGAGDHGGRHDRRHHDRGGWRDHHGRRHHRRRRQRPRRCRSTRSTCPPEATTELAAGEDLKIGITLPQTGPLAAFGAIAQGLNTQFAKVNADGGVDGHKVVLIAKDDAYDPNKTPPLVTELIEKDKIVASIIQVGTPNVAVGAQAPRGAAARRSCSWAPASRPGAIRRTTRGPSAASWPTTPRPRCGASSSTRRSRAPRWPSSSSTTTSARRYQKAFEPVAEGEGLRDRRDQAARGHRGQHRQRGHGHPRRQPRRRARRDVGRVLPASSWPASPPAATRASRSCRRPARRWRRSSSRSTPPATASTSSASRRTRAIRRFADDAAMTQYKADVTEYGAGRRRQQRLRGHGLQLGRAAHRRAHPGGQAGRAASPGPTS